MDGVRAYWDGQRLLSRYGKEINVPRHFKEYLPSIPLDGELWMGRGTFDQLNSILKSKDSSIGEQEQQHILEKWKSVGYYIFDLPTSTSNTYEERLNEMNQLKLPNHAHIVKSTQCNSMEEMEHTLNTILESGGEGIIAVHPNSKYEPRRTPTRVKVKVSFSFGF